jgi:regulator of replication initiation timing
MEEEITSLKNIIKKQNEKINWLNAHCMRLSNSNVLQSMEVDRPEDRLRCRSKEWAEDDEENNTAQVSKNSKQVRKNATRVYEVCHCVTLVHMKKTVFTMQTVNL